MHIAQFNVAHAVLPLDAPEMASFVAHLDQVNAIADASPGFVWRLRGAQDDGIAYVRAANDPQFLLNLTVWESVETLHAFTYGPHHAAVFRSRRQWFVPASTPSYCLWWIPVGAFPDVSDGFLRLESLTSRGSMPFAFSFNTLFDRDGAPISAMSAAQRRTSLVNKLE